MSKRLLLGIDLGTSGCKITLFDFQGNVIANRNGAYRTYYPRAGCVEQSAEDWWRAACREIQSMLKDGIDPQEIAAVGVDGTSWACIPVDKKGNPLRPAMLWLDRRAEKQADWMKEKAGEERLARLNGNPVDPAYLTPKMLWIKQNEPDTYAQADKFLQSNAFIVHKLTGEYSQDYSQGYGFHFFDIKKGCWDENTAEELGISLSLMAPFYHCHQIVGTITRKASEETGLMPGTPVAAGGLDAACCTLGAGVIKPGQAQEQGGQAGGMSIQADQPLMHPKLILGYHVLPDQWLLQGGTVGGAGTLKWFHEQLGAYEQQQAGELDISPYEVMNREAAGIGAGSDGLIFLPYMAGERSPIWDSRARGVFFGLSYNKTRSHMIRAIMEGVGFSLLHNLETAAEAGAVPTELNSVGGAANSVVWTQIKADITGKTIHVPFSDHAAALGAAILAGVGAGVYRSFEEAVGETVHVTRTHYPNEGKNRIYRGYYELYLELYEKLKDTYQALEHLASEFKGRSDLD
jgi:xylulokinase